MHTNFMVMVDYREKQRGLATGEGTLENSCHLGWSLFYERDLKDTQRSPSAHSADGNKTDGPPT